MRAYLIMIFVICLSPTVNARAFEAQYILYFEKIIIGQMDLKVDIKDRMINVDLSGKSAGIASKLASKWEFSMYHIARIFPKFTPISYVNKYKDPKMAETVTVAYQRDGRALFNITPPDQDAIPGYILTPDETVGALDPAGLIFNAMNDLATNRTCMTTGRMIDGRSVVNFKLAKQTTLQANLKFYRGPIVSCTYQLDATHGFLSHPFYRQHLQYARIDFAPAVKNFYPVPNYLEIGYNGVRMSARIRRLKR